MTKPQTYFKNALINSLFLSQYSPSQLQCTDCGIGEVNPQKKNFTVTLFNGYKVKKLTVVRINHIGKYRHSDVCQ